MYLLISMYTEDKKREDQPDETRDTGDIWGPGGEGGGYWCLQLRQRDATMSPLQSLEEKKKCRYDKTAVNNLFSFTLLNYHWLFILVSVCFVYVLNLPILASADHFATYFICSGPVHRKAPNTFSKSTSIHFSLHGNIAIVTFWITFKLWHIPHSRLLRLHTYPHSSCEKNHKEVTAFNAPNKVSKNVCIFCS